MNSDGHRFLKPDGAKLPASRAFSSRIFPLLAGFWLLTDTAHAVTFTNNARIEINDATNGLSLNPANNQFSLSCWFRMSIPSTATVQDQLIILINRRTGSDADHHAYQIRFNPFSGNVEFTARGTLTSVTNKLIQQPYLDRWYHVAVTRDNNTYKGFLDGRKVFEAAADIGAISPPNGVTVGGLVGGKWFFGDVQEVAIYNVALSEQNVFDRMFQDQTSRPGIRGYYKLGYSTNANDWLHNFAPNPPQGTDPATTNGTGTVEYEETDRAGEQSVFDSRKNGGENALTPLGGAFTWEQTVFSRPTPGIALDFRIGYSTGINSGGSAIGTLDPYVDPSLDVGWRHSFETRVLPDPNAVFSGEIRVIQWNGGIETWVLTNGVYRTRHKEYRGELTNTAPNVFEWTTPERLIYHFRSLSDGAALGGRLAEIRDFNGNHVQVNWDDNTGGISNVVDTAGGILAFRYDGTRLTNVIFGSWQVAFVYAATNRLISKSITNTSGLYTAVSNTWQFQYNTNGLLAFILDPRGNTNTLAQYDQYGRQTNQVDALGRSTATRYGAPGNRQITRIDPGTNSWIETYDRKGHILAQQDPLTNITSYTYDTNGNRLTITEPLGWTTSFGYDARANVIARTNALGEITRWTFHSFFNKAVQEINPLNWTNSYTYDAAGNLTNHSDALGSLVRYTYETNGLVLTSTDANGNKSQFAYDTNGFLIARTDPATNTWQFTVNDVGWKLAEINPFNDTTSFAYDLNGNPVQTTDPLNRTFTRQWDANGNLIAQSDGKNVFTRHAYDAANQRVATTNRVGSVWQFTFTSRGKPDRAIDPLGNTTTNFYDSANRLIAVSDPLGNSITNQYDANGNSVALFDTLGQRWSKTFDRLNRVIAESDPLGDTKSTTYDPAGRILQITTPNGFPSLHFYDGRGRLTKWKDAEGFDWLYAYDGNGNITNITDALGGHYVMTYGPRNERTLERNQDNFEWQYTYDQLLRLKTQRDPNLTLRTRNYDAASRVTSHTLSTGREDTYAYDDNDNPRVIVRRVNGVAVATTSLTYDALDRVTRAVDPFNQSVDYGFDALSRITTLTYPGNRTLTNRYDSLSRLTNQVDWTARQMSYDYDKAGRLIRRAYPNGVVQTNTFDSAGRLTGLSHSPSTINSNSINLALTYAYDRNGNKVGNTERGTFAWPMPSLVDETSRFTAAGRITNRVDALNATNNFTYQYDASGNMTNSAGGGQSWCLTYDEDNRTTSIKWDCGMTVKIITNRYDALGRRIARKVDGLETRYVLDLSDGMERILCDTTASGQVTAYYIHGPDLCYRVDATNNIICYHADAQANIIAVTDGGGTNAAQYAYTPYGRSLGSSVISNLQSQISNPYTFVGSQGVMEELPGLYFMRARYYSADAGVFLSTDPVKKIGPGWKPTAYSYADGNPTGNTDPSGEITQAGAFMEGVMEGIGSEVAGAVRNKFFKEMLLTVGVSQETAESIVKTYGSLGTGYELLVDLGLALDPSGHGGARFLGKWIVKGGVMLNNTPPLPQHQALANNPIARVTSGLSPQNIAQNFQQNPLVQQTKNLLTGATPLLNTQASTANSGAGKPAGQMTSGAVAANNRATTLNQTQPTPVASPSGSSQTSTGSNGTGGNTHSGNRQTTTGNSNPPQSQPASSSTSVWSNVVSYVTSAWNSFTSFFRR